MGKHKKNREYSSDSEASSSSEEIEKKKKLKKSSKKSKKQKSKKKRRKHSSSSSSASDKGGWVEKKNFVDGSPPPAAVQASQREDWMSADNFFIPTFSKEKQLSKSAVEKAGHKAYDPATSSRELNPYYKTGEGGLPSFQRPKENDDDYGSMRNSTRPSTSGNWRKSRQEETQSRRRSRSSSESESHSRSRSRSPVIKERVMLPARPQPEELSGAKEITASHSDFLTDEQMNEVGAKMIKAELMGKTNLASKLKDQLEKAKAFKSSGKVPSRPKEKEQVVLSITNAAGEVRPVSQRDEPSRRPQDKKKKNKRVDTHEGGERTKYYPDDNDDKYDIKQMVIISRIIAYFYANQFFHFSSNARDTSTGKIKTLSLRKRSAKSKTRSKWTWPTFSRTTSGRTSKRNRMNARTRFESISEWKKFSIHATNALTRPRWIKIW